MKEEARVLSIHPTTKGFGFAVLEGPGRLVDWGIKDAGKNKERTTIRRVVELMELYRLDVLTAEDVLSSSSRRRVRARQLVELINETARNRGLVVRSCSRAAVREVFAPAGAVTKHEIAATIAEHFPELAPHLPPPRKPWMSQDERMGIFDAVAFGLVFHFQDETTS